MDIVLANNNFLPETTRRGGRRCGRCAPKAVRLRWPPASQPAPRLVLDDVIDPADAHHHDPVRLAAAVMRVLESETAMRRRSAGRTTGRTA